MFNLFKRFKCRHDYKVEGIYYYSKANSAHSYRGIWYKCTKCGKNRHTKELARGKMK